MKPGRLILWWWSKQHPRKWPKYSMPQKANAKGKLIQVYKKDNKQFGIFDLHIEFPFKKVPS